MTDEKILREEKLDHKQEEALEAVMASCHNSWAEVALVFVGGVAFLASGVFPWAIVVTVACMVAWMFVM